MNNVLIKEELKECEKGGKAELKTDFVCSEDDENLYFKFECEQNFPYPEHNEYNKPLYEGDIVEIMLTLKSKNRYLETETNQNGANYCVIIDNKDGIGNIVINKLENCIFKSDVTINKNKWITRIIISKKKLEEIGWRKENCFINAHRQDYDKRGKLNLYSLYPTLSSSFHKVKSFKKLYK